MNAHDDLKIERMRLEALQSEYARRSRALQKNLEAAKAQGSDTTQLQRNIAVFDLGAQVLIDDSKKNIQAIEGKIALYELDKQLDSPRNQETFKPFDDVLDEVKYQLSNEKEKVRLEFIRDFESVKNDAFKKWVIEGGAPKEFDTAWLFIVKMIKGE